MRTLVGYSWLIEHYALPVIDHWQQCYIDSATRGRKEQDLGTHNVQLFEGRYQPEGSLVGHPAIPPAPRGLEFTVTPRCCLIQVDPHQLVHWITESPNSVYARRACFLYEWLRREQLPIDQPVPSKASYVDVVDTAQQFGSGVALRDTRYRVMNNLLGTPDFCPTVRRTDFLTAMVQKDLRQRTRERLERYDKDLLRRAAAFLYLKDTQSSFEVEREKPSGDRTAALCRLATRCGHQSRH